MPISGYLRMVGMHDGCTMAVGNDYEFFGMLCFCCAMAMAMQMPCGKGNKATGLDEEAFRDYVVLGQRNVRHYFLNESKRPWSLCLDDKNNVPLSSLLVLQMLRSLGGRCRECESSLVAASDEGTVAACNAFLSHESGSEWHVLAI